MDRREFIKTAVLGAVTSLPLRSLAQQGSAGDSGQTRSSKPNIILLFADDAGFADFGFQGSSVIKTPHLDRLAQEGVKCTSAYVTAAVCGPSRAGMLTGRYQQRFGFEENNVPGYMSASGLTGDDMGLPLSERTMADYLKELGYRSTILGKWHMGRADRFHPLKRGFDEFYGFRGGARSYFHYTEFPSNAHKLERNFAQYQEHKGYLTDALADEACAFMERNKLQPFFIYLSFNAVHTPMQAREDDLKQITGLIGKRRRLAAMTMGLDRACGRVLTKLKALGLDRNTLVVFTNDNGGPCDTNASVNDPLSGTKATHLEGGIRVPFIIRWQGILQPNTVYDKPISTLDLLPTFVNAAGGDAKSIDGLDGVDLLPYLKNPSEDYPHTTLFWKKETRAAVRNMEWKLIRLPDRPAQLYNLKNDISEKHDLAAKYPGKVEELYKMLFAWELELERPLWQLQRKYENWNRKRFDDYRK